MYNRKGLMWRGEEVAVWGMEEMSAMVVGMRGVRSVVDTSGGKKKL